MLPWKLSIPTFDTEHQNAQDFPPPLRLSGTNHFAARIAARTSLPPKKLSTLPYGNNKSERNSINKQIIFFMLASSQLLTTAMPGITSSSVMQPEIICAHCARPDSFFCHQAALRNFGNGRAYLPQRIPNHFVSNILFLLNQPFLLKSIITFLPT